MKIILYEEQYVQDFARLNREWLEGFGLLEEADEQHLSSPRESIIDNGGQIFFAVEGKVVLGTCAAIRHGREVVEIAKLAVVHSEQRQGIGRLLIKRVIDYAQSIGARKVSLVSNTQLRSALRLYESMGFAHAPMPVNPDYKSADVYMERVLSSAAPAD